MMIMTLFTQKDVCVRGLVLSSHVHLPVTYFLFHDTTSHLVLALSGSLCPKYGTPDLFTSANLKHTLSSHIILRRTTFCQPISPPSGPCNAPWFSSETLAQYKSLTYLLITEKILLTTDRTHRNRSAVVKYRRTVSMTCYQPNNLHTADSTVTNEQLTNDLNVS